METGKRAGGESTECQGGYRKSEAGGRKSRTGGTIWAGSRDPLWEDQGTGEDHRRLFRAAGQNEFRDASYEGRGRCGRHRGGRGKGDGNPRSEDVAKRKRKTPEPRGRIA